MTIERKLPLMMTGVLVAVLASSLVLTYGTLARTGEVQAREHLADAARVVASGAAGSVGPAGARLRALGDEPAVRRALAGATSVADTAAARATLAAAVARGDSGLVVELRDARGRRVAGLVVSDDAGATAAAPPLAPPHERALAEAIDAGGWAEGIPVGPRFGPLYPADGRVYFWIVAPIVARDSVLGFVARQRQVGGPREALESLRELIGAEVTLYTRNAERGGVPAFWARSPGVPSAAPTRRDSGAGGLYLERPGVGRTLAAEAPVAGTSWVMVLETPVRAVHARARDALLPLSLLGMLLTGVGAVLSWAVSRRITRPLVSLTTAAESVARGDYAGRAGGGGRALAGDEIGRLAASFDEMAREVAASRRELERRVADAQQSRAEAERANRAKGDFLAVMSHELRTPLNAIGGYAQLLELEVYGPVTEAQRDTLARIARSQAHLLALIDDVLSFAKIDAGRVRYAIEDVPVEEALSALEALVAPQVRARALTFVHRPGDPRLVARADREKLQQVVLNLLGNAIKFTPERGRVELACEGDDRWVRVTVRDTGIGVPAERLATIFDPFVQGDRALNRPNEGVGLGLAISRDLARGMGGELAVESAVGAGSTFTLTLPRQTADAVIGRGAGLPPVAVPADAGVRNVDRDPVSPA